MVANNGVESKYTWDSYAFTWVGDDPKNTSTIKFVTELIEEIETTEGLTDIFYDINTLSVIAYFGEACELNLTFNYYGFPTSYSVYYLNYDITLSETYFYS